MARGDANDHSWIRTFTGRQFWPLEPRAEDVCIEDIAHHLAQKCRWTGAVHQFLSVAEHSIRVARYVRDGEQPRHALTALLHDATEAYLPDMSRPLKHANTALGKAFCQAERRVWQAIAKGLAYTDLPHHMRDFPEIVHYADDVLLRSEGRDLVRDYEWRGGEVLVEAVVPWEPTKAEREFLEMYYELTGQSYKLSALAFKPAVDILREDANKRSTVLDYFCGADKASSPSDLADTFTTSQYASHVGIKHSYAHRRLLSLEQDGVITRTTIQVSRSTGRGSYLYPTPAWRYTGGSTPSTQGTQATTGTSPTTLATKELYQDGVSPRAVRLQGTAHSADPRARDATAAGAGTTGRRRGAGAKKAVAQSPATRGPGRGRPATIRTAGVRAGRRRTGA